MQFHYWKQFHYRRILGNCQREVKRSASTYKLYSYLIILPTYIQQILKQQIDRSDQISHSVVSDSLRPHESQHARPLYPSPTPGVHSDSRPSSQRCHPAISSSVVPFSSCPQFLPASEILILKYFYLPYISICNYFLNKYVC